MPSIQNRFLRIIKDSVLIPEQSSFLVAVSGGVDSMVLSSLMKGSELNFALAHCNFKLRGTESDNDQELVSDAAERMNVPFFVEAFETKTYAQQKAISTQMAARELRYAWFAEVMKREGFDFLVVAHHANDNFETALFNLAKGTGIAGLRGIKPIREKTFRPLLSFTKKEILAYAIENNIKWREDKSNESLDYHRNFIRAELIPRLEKVNPSLIKTYAHSSKRLLGLEKILDHKLQSFEQFFLDKNGFSLPFKEMDKGVNRELFIELLLRKGFELNSVESFLFNKEGLTGGKIEGLGYTLWRERQCWQLVTAVKSEDEQVSLQKEAAKFEIGPFTISTSKEMDISLKQVLSEPNSIYIDADKWRFPLELREWKKGDRMQPFGMKGSKLVSDILIDQKIPAHSKKQQYVLSSRGEILAILGLKTSEKLRFTKQIDRAFKINYDCK